MKKLCLLFVTLLVVCTSCSSDDDNGGDMSQVDITGTWNLTGMESEGEASVEYQGLTIPVPYEAHGEDFDAQVEISENPNLLSSFGTFKLVTTVVFLGESTTQEEMVDFSTQFTEASWSIEGNQLTTVNNGVTQTAEIISLTQNEMVLVSEEVIDYAGVEVNAVIEMTLTR